MDILALLKKYGIELTEENLDAFNKEFRRVFKSEAELKKHLDKINTLEETVATLNTELETSKTSIATLTKDKETFEQELTSFRTADAEAKEKTLYNEALKGVEFVSDRVRKSIISELKDKNLEVVDGKLQGVDAVLQEIYTNDKGIFKSVDSALHTWSGSSDDNKGDDKKVNLDVFNRIL